MTIIRIGFTGTREGMTRFQLQAVWNHMNYLTVIHDTAEPAGLEAHHGDCRGSDAQFHVMATVLGWRTVAHPPLNSRLRAFCQADEIREPKDYLSRDWDIVNETGELIAAPKAHEPQPHSGTWITIGYANQLHRPGWIFLPEGQGRRLSSPAGVRA